MPRAHWRKFSIHGMQAQRGTLAPFLLPTKSDLCSIPRKRIYFFMSSYQILSMYPWTRTTTRTCLVQQVSSSLYHFMGTNEGCIYHTVLQKKNKCGNHGVDSNWTANAWKSSRFHQPLISLHRNQSITESEAVRMCMNNLRPDMAVYPLCLRPITF